MTAPSSTRTRRPRPALHRALVQHVPPARRPRRARRSTPSGVDRAFSFASASRPDPTDAAASRLRRADPGPSVARRRARSARFAIHDHVIDGRYGDGTRYSLRAARLCARVRPGLRPLGDGVQSQPARGAAVDRSGAARGDRRSRRSSRAADPDDRDGDGISGRPNWSRIVAAASSRSGRFGWKAERNRRSQQQTAGAFSSDIGHHVVALSEQNRRRRASRRALRYISGGEPELDERQAAARRLLLRACSGFQRSALPPTPRSVAARASSAPSGCAGCHLPAQHDRRRTRRCPPTPTRRSSRSPTCCSTTWGPALPTASRRSSDGIGMAHAAAVGDRACSRPSTGTRRYLHDGRARDLAEAILWHGGEATRARDDFERLTAAERAALLAFLNSL